MAIQLRYSTKPQQEASPVAFGVGLPVSDGGLGAVSQALGQIGNDAASAALRLKKQEDKLKEEAVNAAYLGHRTALSQEDQAARLALETGDFDAYAEAEERIRALNPDNEGFSLSAFLPAQERTIHFEDKDWQEAHQRSRYAFSEIEGKLNVAAVNKRYFMRYENEFNAIQKKGDEIIQSASFSAADLSAYAGIMSSFLDRTATDEFITPEAKAVAEAKMADNFSNVLTGYQASKEKFQSIEEYNKGLLATKDTVRTSPAFANNRDALLAQIDRALVDTNKGSIHITSAFDESIKEYVGNSLSSTDFSDPKQIASFRHTIQSYLSMPNLAEEDKLRSFYSALSVREWFDTPEARILFQDWVTSDAENKPEEFFKKNLEGVKLELLETAHRNALISAVSKYAEELLSAPRQTAYSIKDVGPGKRFVDKMVMAATSSREAQATYDAARERYMAAASQYDPTDPDAYAPALKEATSHLSSVIGPQDASRFFPGLAFAMESISANPKSPATIHRNAALLQQMWGPEKTALFASSFATEDKTSPMRVLAASMSLSSGMEHYADTDYYANILNGLNEKDWVEKNADNSSGRRYAEFTKYVATNGGLLGSSKIAEFMTEMSMVDPAEEDLIRTFFIGKAMRMLEENQTLSAEALDEEIGNQLNDMIVVISDQNDYGQAMFRNRLPEKGFRSGFELGIEAVYNVLDAPGSLIRSKTGLSKLIGGEGRTTYNNLKALVGFGGPDATSKKRYGEYRLKALALYAHDNLGLMAAIMPYFNENSDLYKRFGGAGTGEDAQLRYLIEHGFIREGKPRIVNGVEAATLQLLVEQKSADRSLWQMIVGGYTTTNSTWVTVQNDKGEDILIFSRHGEITEPMVDAIEDRLFWEGVEQFGQGLTEATGFHAYMTKWLNK